ncbi:MAG: ABC transporter ATP-binding protein [Acidobacteriota bacterium]
MGALRAVDLGKAYRSYRRPIDSLKELILRRPYAELFWAIRGVNLDVPRGGSLGIVGDNGAGKTTLLKMLAGASSPTEGRVEREGRASAILSLGAGFHADLTGAENIRIGCAVLGLSPDETAELAPAVIEFSELGKFIDKPLKTYSSGMYLRLAFSVATAIDPEILIVDEHLSVGDQHFRHKCLRRIMVLREAGCSLVFCSHDMYSVGEVCERTLWIRDGKVAMLGTTADVIKEYQDVVRLGDSDLPPIGLAPAASPGAEVPTGEISFTQIELRGPAASGTVQTGDSLELWVSARVTARVVSEGLHVALVIVRNDGTWCYGVTSRDDGAETALFRLANEEMAVRFVIERLPLLSGAYSFTVALMDNSSPHCYDYRLGAAPFTVRHQSKEIGIVRLEHRWMGPDL